MIVLDTNVVSEAMKPQPQPIVRAWPNDPVAETLYLSSVTLAELLFGVAALPTSGRKTALSEIVEGLVSLFNDRVLPFDTPAARCYADLAVLARSSGRRLPTPDGYIAASRGFILASRDTSPYEATGVAVVNPWEA